MLSNPDETEAPLMSWIFTVYFLFYGSLIFEFSIGILELFLLCPENLGLKLTLVNLSPYVERVSRLFLFRE